MDFTKAREELKPRLQEYVERIAEKSQGPYMYICPICGSGTGKNHTGAFSINAKDPTRWKCFACTAGGDIFDLIGQVENIKDPLEQLKKAAELFGLDLTGESSGQAAFKKGSQNQPKSERYTHDNIHTSVYTQPQPAKKETDRLPYIRECSARLQETDYHTRRGISDETAKSFLLGYDPSFKGTGGDTWQALIIPTGRYSYVARNTDPTARTGSRYKKAGPATPINTRALQTAEKPIFITEGELDALSIIEVGGEAVGLGSTANIHSFISKYIKQQRPAQPLILALDIDAAGQKATEELAKALEDLAVPFYRANPYNGQKDANSALLADREAFTASIAEAEAQAAHMEIETPKEAEAVEPAAITAEEALEAAREEYLKNSAGSHLQEFIDGIAASADTPAQPTGFTKLDETLDGGLYEGLYIIGAITSLGKTTLALQIADQIAAAGRDVLIFSLEMARAELMSKSISRHTLLLDLAERPGKEPRNAKTARGITAGARYRQYSQEERELIQRAVTAYGEYAGHIFIQEGMGDIGADTIRETVEKHERITGQAPVVLVDYVQILAPHDVRATDKQNTDKAVLELKRISRDYKIPVIGISSFNRASYKEEVDLEAFKESGSLEYGSDVLIGLQLKGAGRKDFNSTEAKTKDPREIELVILKNRNGKTGAKLAFNYYPLFNYFTEA